MTVSVKSQQTTWRVKTEVNQLDFVADSPLTYWNDPPYSSFILGCDNEVCYHTTQGHENVSSFILLPSMYEEAVLP